MTFLPDDICSISTKLYKNSPSQEADAPAPPSQESDDQENEVEPETSNRRWTEEGGITAPTAKPIALFFPPPANASAHPPAHAPEAGITAPEPPTFIPAHATAHPSQESDDQENEGEPETSNRR